MAILIMKKFKIINIMMLAALAVVLSSCEKKVLCYLDEHPHNPYYVHTAMTVNFNSQWADDVNPYLNNPSDYTVRYTFEFWTYNLDGNPVERVARAQFLNGELHQGDNTYTCNIDLPAEKMKAIVFVDFLKKGEETNPVFILDSLTSVKLNTMGFDPQKDAFSIADNLDFSGYATNHPPVEGYQAQATLNAKRIFSCYKLIADDYDDFDKERKERGENLGDPDKVNVVYNLWLPIQYNAFYQLPQMGKLGKGYVSTAKAHQGTYVELATDVIFTGANDEASQYYNLGMNVLDTNGVLLTSNGNILADIHRNHITYIYGKYLTTSNVGATGINDSFDQEINIWMDANGNIVKRNTVDISEEE